MKVTEVTGSDTSVQLKLGAVYKDGAYPPDGSDEDNTFARWTPQADLTMTINNPDLIGKFAVGQKFYLDFTEVDAA
jgi:hypothetical protein